MKISFKRPFLGWIIGTIYFHNFKNRFYINLKDINGKWHSTTYARYLMQLKLGLKLDSKQIVHHKDENKLNDKISNLELINSQTEHLAKFHSRFTYNKNFKCSWCKCKVIKIPKQQSQRLIDMRNNKCTENVFCSRSCQGKFGVSLKRLQ